MVIRNAIIYAAFAGHAFAAEKVITGTAKNWDSLHEEHKSGFLAEFYAPWCGHCKKIAPELEKAAETLESEGSTIKIIKVDATVETTLGTKYEVNGYPTLKWFIGGEATEYDGPREAPGIVDWIKSMTGPAVTEGPADETATFAITWHGAELGWFEDVAKANRKKAKWHWIKAEGASKVVIKHLNEDAIESSPADKAELETWFKANQFPLYGAMDGESYGNYLQSGKGMIWTLLEMTAENAKEKSEEARPMMTNIAKAFSSGDQPLLTSWTNTVEFKKVLEGMFGITEFPRLVINLKMGDKKNYIYDGEMVESKITEFIKKVQAGEIQPNLKSEEPPAEQGAVTVVTGKTLEQIVFHPEKDVLLEIYAPWCGHCKKLEPEYTKVAKKVIKENFTDIITIAKMDGTLNDSPVDSIQWSGFPTIVYVKAGSTEVIKYDDARDAKGIWKWIKNNHSKKDDIKARLAKNQEDKKKDATKEEL